MVDLQIDPWCIHRLGVIDVHHAPGLPEAFLDLCGERAQRVRIAAVEILLNTPTVSEKIFKGEFHELKGVMNKSRELGMRTFDWALFELYNEGRISYEEAIRNADSQNEVRLRIKLESKRAAQNLLEDEVVKKMQMQVEDEGQILRR